MAERAGSIGQDINAKQLYCCMMVMNLISLDTLGGRLKLKIVPGNNAPLLLASSIRLIYIN